jgi:hypothetical protein
MFLLKRAPKHLSIRALVVGIAAAVLGLIAPASALALPAPTLLLTLGGNGKGTESTQTNLYRVDPATGGVTSVGLTGYAITGLAQDPTTGILYGVSNNNSPTAKLTLLTIDPATGAATPVGPLGKTIADISFNSLGGLYGWSESGDDLASIDKATGAVTIIPSELETYGSGNAFDKNDNFWLFPEGEGGESAGNEGGIFTVDLQTGSGTLHGKLKPLDENESSISAATYDCARTTLYATVNNFGEPPANLVTIDTVTGSLTNKGLVPTGADGLEWYCPLAFEFPSASAIVGKAGKQTLSVPVVRGPRIAGAASVGFATVAGSAHAGRDFVAASGTLNFANNASEATVPLTVTPDPRAGVNRQFNLALLNPSSGGSVGNAYTVTINASKPKRAKVKGPKKTSAKRVIFKLTSNQLPAKFRCKLDKRKYKACGKNSKKGKKYKTPKLSPGRHKLVVQVVNGAGLKSKPAKKKFTVLP